MEWRAVTKAAVKAALDYAAQGAGTGCLHFGKEGRTLEGLFLRSKD